MSGRWVIHTSGARPHPRAAPFRLPLPSGEGWGEGGCAMGSANLPSPPAPLPEGEGGDRRRRNLMGHCAAILLLLALIGCGGNGANGQQQPEYATATAPARTEPAPRPTEPLPPDATCINEACHAPMHEARHIHQPVAAMACDACHGPDTGNHEFPLKRQGNETCTFCHSVAGVREHQHAAVEEDGCITCHDPHGSPTKFQLTAISTERLCARCHDMQWDRYVHTPFAEGQCTLCHEPHQADNRGLLRGPDGPDHCLGCHEDRRSALSAAPMVHEPVRDDCLSCHGPHSGPATAHTLAPTRKLCASCHDPVIARIEAQPMIHSATTMDAACGNCHDPHAGHTALLPDREDRVCMSCHTQAVEADDGRRIPAMERTMKRAFLHGPIRAGECSPCHDPHAAPHPALLHQPVPATFYAPFNVDDYELCFSCHSPDLVLGEDTARVTGFRDGQANLHYIHVKRPQRGRTCRTCHDVHASDQPHHVAATVAFEGSDWAMPINFQRRDDGGRCAPGCHEPKTYRRNGADSTRGVP